MEADESDKMPLDGGPDLTEGERAAFREMLREQTHATWLRRRLRKVTRVWLPVLVAVGGGIVWAIDWVPKHFKP